MRKSGWVVAMVFVGAFGFVATGAEKPPDDYVKAMKDISAAAAALGKVEPTDFAGAAKLGQTVKTSMTVAQTYWRNKGVADALEQANAAIKAIDDLGVAAGMSSTDGVEAAVKDLRATCAACHTAHRERMPDGTYMIK
jgi:cytochrome c556